MHTALQGRDPHGGAPDAPLFGKKSAAIATGGILGRIGPLEVRLAVDAAEVAAAQEVRYRVFYDELGAKQDISTPFDLRDSDRFDAVCDHLLVFDTRLPGPAHRQIVGTYRLLRQEKAATAGGFYSSDEFELEALAARHPHLSFLELGRSCVLPAYRTKRVIEVLWQGIWAYINHYDVGVMTGCASFHGTDPLAHSEALTYLAHNCRASGAWQVRAVAGRYHTMELMPIEAVSARAAIAALPPLIKGYIRVGAKIGDGCVIDHAFGTTDVFIVMPVAELSERHVNYYAGEADRFAA